MEHPPITIQVDFKKNEAITVSPTSLPVDAGDSVRWTVVNDPKAPFLVFFDDGEGFEVKSAKGERLHSVEVRNGQVAVATGNKKGVFQYKVAVSIRDPAGEQRIYAVMNCPEVIIK